MISHGFYFRCCSLTVQFDVAAYTSFFKYWSTVDVFVFAGKKSGERKQWIKQDLMTQGIEMSF